MAFNYHLNSANGLGLLWQGSRYREGSGDVLAFWQPRCRRNLGDYDAAEISANFGGFIRVLLEWENRERKKMMADWKPGPDANGEDK